MSFFSGYLRGYIYRIRYLFLLILLCGDIYFIYKLVLFIIPSLEINYEDIWKFLNSNLVSGIITGVIFSTLFSYYISKITNKKGNEEFGLQMQALLRLEFEQIIKTGNELLKCVLSSNFNFNITFFPNAVFKLIPSRSIIDLTNPEITINLIMFYANIEHLNQQISNLNLIIHRTNGNVCDPNFISHIPIGKIIEDTEHIIKMGTLLMKEMDDNLFLMQHQGPQSFLERLDFEMLIVLELG